MGDGDSPFDEKGESFRASVASRYPMTTPSARMEALLGHSQWVRLLAHRLGRDPDLAEDLAQETLLAALEEEREPRSLRAWMGQVLRNRVWERLRGEDRRRAREDAVSDRGDAPSTDELLERMSVHRSVVEVVLDLPEHYREVIVRRYYEGETPTRIAASLGIPISTVKTRLARAHVAIRTRLEEHYRAEGRSWMAALTPLVRLPTSAPPPSVGPSGSAATALETGAAKGFGGFVALALAAAAAVLLFAAVGRDWGAGGDVGRGVVPPPAPLLATGTPGSTAGSTTRSVPARELVSEAEPLVELADVRALHSPARRIAGRLFDARGAPLASVLVRYERYGERGEARDGSGAQVALTGADGSFSLSRVDGGGRVLVARDDLMTVCASEAAGAEAGGTRAHGELVVVAAPRTSLAGVVRRADGTPLAGAELHLRLPDGWRERFDVSLERASSVSFATISGQEGAFALEAPELAGAALVASYEGLRSAEHALGVGSAEGLELVLHERHEGRVGLVRGRVVDAAGRPLAGARVSAEVRTTRTAFDGTFALDATSAGPSGERPTRLLALVPGVGATSFVPEADAMGQLVWPSDVELRLPSAPLTLRGRVTDSSGRGLRDVQVFLADPTVFRDASEPGEADVELRGMRLETVLPDLVETQLAGADATPYVTTSEDGSFELSALIPRSYRLVALDRRTLLRVEAGPFPAGSDGVRLQLDPAASTRTLEGVVRDGRGAPVGGCTLRLQTHGFRVEHAGRRMFTDLVSGRATTTDAEGRFRLSDVPKRSVRLRLEGRRLRTDTVELDDVDPAEALDLVVTRLASLRVELAEPGRADAFRIEGVAGEVLDLELRLGNRRERRRGVELIDGRSQSVDVPVTAQALVLLLGDEVVERVELFLSGTGVEVVRL